MPHYFKGEIYSPYQLFANTFGPCARQTAGGFFLISETLAAGVRVYVASIPVKLILGDKLLGFGTGDPILGAILLFVILSDVYKRQACPSSSSPFSERTISLFPDRISEPNAGSLLAHFNWPVGRWMQRKSVSFLASPLKA